jgi:hypothetical protein
MQERPLIPAAFFCSSLEDFQVTELAYVPKAPAPDIEWMRQFTDHLRAKRPRLPVFSARQLALQAFAAMFLLTPHEACELWDQKMLATVPLWRNLA